MNIRLVARCAVIACLVAPAYIANADQKPKVDREPMSPAAASQSVSKKDVLGDWQTQGEGWRMVLNADHSAAIYSEGVFESKPSFTTWKLVDNHVIISDASLFKIGNIVALGNDFLLISYKNQFVMLSKRELPIAEKRGFAACNCLWRSAQKSDKGKY